MSDNPPSSPRKQPRQQRARQTVQRLLDAAAELIEDHGLETLTTNRIAEHAGVNIASLYQYFPHKDAIVAALVESWLQEVTRQLGDMLSPAMDMPIAESTHLWCQAGLMYFRQRPALLALLLRVRDRPEDWPAARQLELRLMEIMRRFLLPRRDSLATPDLDLGIQTAYTAAAAVLLRQLTDPVPYYRDEQIIGEVVRLITGYFRP
ncbi:MAG: TetR/AcrR family transcriptional regulator [Fluviicoccus sp.]|uniref:TetR/AcrR family transcriptional regulator n=1 Tax=Fluviicoccus sp. TaxID=2003552 RepID=UPI00271D758E|nr:TetR/AcrR family transcriptional regulator [Fluviicoccus sp.]MDO8330607.1 TetR/AcrR family transcriptional regulator [Fluviicoccus sp.]